jgi:integral membrane sensor domain MASE1
MDDDCRGGILEEISPGTSSKCEAYILTAMGRREYNKRHVSFSTRLPSEFFIDMLRGNPRYLAGLTVLVFAYLAWAQFSLWLAPIAQPCVPPIWPPTGIGLSVVIIFGYRYWPGILVGESALTASMGISVQVALGIGAGNTLEAMLGAYLLQRVRGFDRTLTRLSDVWAFVTLAALVAPTLGATIGSVSLGWGQISDLPRMTEIWWTWWLGDAVGALLVAPVLLTWTSTRLNRWRWHQIMEVSALVTLLILLGVLVFGGWVVPPVSYPLEYLFFPFVVWSALRLGQGGSTLTILVATVIAVWDWSHGLGPMAVEANLESLLELQSFLGVLSVTGMALAAAINERRAAEAALQARAAELQELNLVLNSEIGQRKQAEQLARGQRDALAKALLFLTAESDLDKFLGHVLKVMIDELRGIGGALWFPDREAGSVRLHLEYVEGHLLSAAQSKHPAPCDPIFFGRTPSADSQELVCNGSLL